MISHNINIYTWRRKLFPKCNTYNKNCNHFMCVNSIGDIFLNGLKAKSTFTINKFICSQSLIEFLKVCLFTYVIKESTFYTNLRRKLISS